MGWCWGSFGWGGAWGGMNTFGLILGLVSFAGLVAVLGVGTTWAVRRVRAQDAPDGTRADPLAVARRRLSAGEITPAEYDEIRDRLLR